jgi:hypothetical protein
MELTLSIFRVCETFKLCHSNVTNYNCRAVTLTFVQQIKSASIIYGHPVLKIV